MLCQNIVGCLIRAYHTLPNGVRLAINAGFFRKETTRVLLTASVPGTVGVAHPTTPLLGCHRPFQRLMVMFMQIYVIASLAVMQQVTCWRWQLPAESYVAGGSSLQVGTPGKLERLSSAAGCILLTSSRSWLLFRQDVTSNALTGRS